MTHDEAIKLAEEYHRIGDQLREAYPCRECEGSGDGAPYLTKHSADGGVPCPACWGRGWLIDVDD